jgi:hypothetical protein
LSLLFDSLDINNVMLVFSLALLEKKILLVSSQYSLLTYAAEAIRSLLYPFEWQHVYVPILPDCLIEFVASPTPFIMGVHSSYFRVSDLLRYATDVCTHDKSHSSSNYFTR